MAHTAPLLRAPRRLNLNPLPLRNSEKGSPPSGNQPFETHPRFIGIHWEFGEDLSKRGSELWGLYASRGGV